MTKKKKERKKYLSGGKKNHLSFDKVNDIMLLHNIHSCSAFSEENKAAFPQRAGRLRPSLWIFRISLLFKRSFTKYWESYPGILGMMDLTPLHPHTAFHSYYGKGSHASFRFSKNFLHYKELRITVLEKVILWATRGKGLKEFWWQVGLTCAHSSSSSPPSPSVSMEVLLSSWAFSLF